MKKHENIGPYLEICYRDGNKSKLNLDKVNPTTPEKKKYNTEKYEGNKEERRLCILYRGNGRVISKE